MAQPERNLRINYIEFPATDIEAMKRFYSDVFGWVFQDYGPDYTSFHDGSLAGGFTKDAISAGAEGGKTRGPLIVIYAASLEDAYTKVKAAGGRIGRETFGCPGGRRFHFADPNNNELSVWSE
jgi:predicted enzyme related to lactoylglutathione lyase